MKEDLTPPNIQDYWAQGVHISSDGKEWDIADMPTAYLQNVIDKFKSMGFDVSSLESAAGVGEVQTQDSTTGFAPDPIEETQSTDYGFAPTSQALE